jgi:hypothetical protein
MLYQQQYPAGFIICLLMNRMIATGRGRGQAPPLQYTKGEALFMPTSLEQNHKEALCVLVMLLYVAKAQSDALSPV